MLSLCQSAMLLNWSVSFHPLQLILAKNCTKRICKYMKKINYFSFIQALLCILVSTKCVCNYVQFFYFIENFNKTFFKS